MERKLGHWPVTAVTPSSVQLIVRLRLSNHNKMYLAPPAGVGLTVQICGAVPVSVFLFETTSSVCLKPLQVSACFLSELGTQLFLTLITVTQTMLVKLQPASGTRLPPYNPVLPPPAVSQVLLLANPQRVSYMHVTVTTCLP